MVRRKPTKLTPELQDAFCRRLAQGCYIQTACAAVGISRSAYQKWMKAAESQESGVYAEFAKAVKLVLADAETSGIIALREAGKSDWKATAWWLERRFARRWGKTQGLEVRGPKGALIEVKSIDASAREKAEKIARLAGIVLPDADADVPQEPEP